MPITSRKSDNASRKQWWLASLLIGLGIPGCAAADGGSYCFPNCSVAGGCGNYPGTTCVTVTTIDGWTDHEVCAQ